MHSGIGLRYSYAFMPVFHLLIQIPAQSLQQFNIPKKIKASRKKTEVHTGNFFCTEITEYRKKFLVCKV